MAVVEQVTRFFTEVKPQCRKHYITSGSPFRVLNYVTDVLTCKQHFDFVDGSVGANFTAF